MDILFFTSNFNNREIAFVFWFMVALIWLSTVKSVRNAILNLVKTFFNKAILIPAIIFLTSFLSIYAILCHIQPSLWNAALLKITITWILFSGLIVLFKYATYKGNLPPAKTLIRDNLSFTLLLEYIYNLYSFGLLIELILLPILVFIGAMWGFAQTNKEYKIIEKLFEKIAICFGLGVFAYSIYQTYLNFDKLKTVNTAGEILLPIIYFFFLLPVIYVVKYFFEYQTFFALFSFLEDKNVIRIKNNQVRKYFQHKIKSYFKTDYNELNHFQQYCNIQPPDLKSNDDVDKFVEIYIARSTLKPFNDNTIGFDPKLCEQYLSKLGFKNDYYKYGDYDEEGFGGYWATFYNRVGDFDIIEYNLEGNQQAVLRIILEFGECIFDSNNDKHYKKYTKLSAILYKKCLNAKLPEDFCQCILEKKNSKFNFNNYKVLFDIIKPQADSNHTYYKFIIQIDDIQAPISL